jgi:tetratricopeptide (TPR) repeat protein/DNA-binding MarR family transcriptional regulator
MPKCSILPRIYPSRGIPLVRRYVRKRTFSTVDRVLIHLSSEALHPEELTQDGIAAATRSGRSTLTKWLDRLEGQELVARERIRLDGRPLPRYAYHLTEFGWQAASALRERIGSQVIIVRARSAGPLTVRMSEVPNLASARLDLTHALSLVRKGRLDLTRLAATARGRAPRAWGSGLRRVDRLFGRKEELKAMDAWYRSDSPVLLVTGIPGIGKSSAVAGWVQGRPLKVPIYGFEIHGSSTQAGLLADFGAFLAALGKPGLATFLAQGVPLELAFVGRLLERDLADIRLLLVLDNADQAPRDVVRLVKGVFIGPKLAAKVVLLGRRSPRWLGRARRGAASYETLHVRGLDPKASQALLHYRGLGPDSTFIQEIVRKTRGHPLLLHLAASTGASRGSAVQRYLKEEVWDTLSTEDHAILEAASVFRTAVSERILGTVAKTNHHALESLTERNLLERTVAGGYMMHDLVREFVREQLSEARRQDLHARAADPLLHATDPRERWQGVYHLLEAGRVTEAATFLDSEGAPLLDSVAAEEISALVGGLTLDEARSAAYCVFAEVLGDSLRVRGHIGPAIFQYGHARRLVEASHRPERVPRLLRKMAFLERCRNHYARALGYLVEARGRLLEQYNAKEMDEVLREMALVEQALGELSKATRHLNEAIDLATETNDWGGLSRALLALSSLETFRGNRDRGLDYSLEGLRVADRLGSLTQMAHAHIVVGTALAELQRFRESLHHFEIGLQLSNATGNLRLTAYATMNRTGALLDLGRYELAAGSIKEARGYFEILEERDTLALLKVYEGQLEMGFGHWARALRAWEEGLSGLREFGSPVDLVKALREVGSFHIDRAMLVEGQAYLREAQRVAAKVGNPALISEIEDDLRRPGTLAPGSNGA